MHLPCKVCEIDAKLFGWFIVSWDNSKFICLHNNSRGDIDSPVTSFDVAPVSPSPLTCSQRLSFDRAFRSQSSDFNLQFFSSYAALEGPVLLNLLYCCQWCQFEFPKASCLAGNHVRDVVWDVCPAASSTDLLSPSTEMFFSELFCKRRRLKAYSLLVEEGL